MATWMGNVHCDNATVPHRMVVMIHIGSIMTVRVHRLIMSVQIVSIMIEDETVMIG